MTPEQAYTYCEKYGRDEQLEKIILTDLYYAYRHARCTIKGRWKEAEKNILADPGWAFHYAQDVIKDRWIEAENVIATNSIWTFRYAREVIKGKLPDNMHNMMLLHADKHAKEYLNFINKI